MSRPDFPKLPDGVVRTGETASSAADGLRFDPLTVGTWCGILSAAAYTGANMALRQVARPEDMDWAIWVSCLKAVPATVVAWLLIGHRAWRGLPALPPRRLVVPLVLTGLMMQFGGNVLFQWALGLGGLALTVPLNFATLMLSGAWLGRLVLDEPVTGRSAIAMGLLIASIAALSAGADDAARAVAGQAAPLTVLAAVLGACAAGVAYGVSGVVIRRTVTRDVSLSATLVWLSTTGVVGLGLTSLVRMGPERLAETSAGELTAVLIAGLLNAVAFFAVTAALRYIAVVRVNLLNASQAAMAAAAGVLWFDERLTAWLVLGTLLTMIGLLLRDDR